MIVDLEHRVDQPVEVVFAAMADISRRPEWVALAVERTKYTDGPIGVGSKYKARDNYPGRQAEFIQEITAFEPDHLLGESWGGPLPGQMETRFVSDNGSTILDIRIEIVPSGVLRVMVPLVKGWLRRALEKDYRRFEETVGSGSFRP